MLFKILTVILAILLSAETAYILKLQHPSNRFQFVGGYDGFVALDTRDGRLCRTWPEKLSPATEDASDEAKLLRVLPSCWSIR
jgi:hypothetical protein